jgi:hypothetical protein
MKIAALSILFAHYNGELFYFAAGGSSTASIT